MFIGIYDHPPSSTLEAAGVTGREVADSRLAEVGQFATSYAVKTAIWLLRLPL